MGRVSALIGISSAIFAVVWMFMPLEVKAPKTPEVRLAFREEAPSTREATQDSEASPRQKAEAALQETDPVAQIFASFSARQPAPGVPSPLELELFGALKSSAEVASDLVSRLGTGEEERDLAIALALSGNLNADSRRYLVEAGRQGLLPAKLVALALRDDLDDAGVQALVDHWLARSSTSETLAALNLLGGRLHKADSDRRSLWIERVRLLVDSRHVEVGLAALRILGSQAQLESEDRATLERIARSEDGAMADCAARLLTRFATDS